MKLTNPNENRVVIIVKSATRDANTGKFVYVTEKSIDLFQTTPAEVVALVEKTLQSATGEKIPGASEGTKTETKGKK